MFVALTSCGAVPSESSATPSSGTPEPDTQACAPLAWEPLGVVVGFESGSAELDSADGQLLHTVVAAWRGDDWAARVRVEGHFETCPDEGGSMELSAARAESVGMALVGLGVDIDQIDLIGLGAPDRYWRSAPCTPDLDLPDDETGRRVEFSLLTCDLPSQDQAP